MMKSLQIALVLTALDRASAPVEKVGKAVGAIGRYGEVAAAKLAKVQERLKTMADTTEQFGRRSLVAGTVTAAAVGKVMQPFEELEDATARMELAYSNAQGKATKYFENIRRQTVDLGNKLPGTTRDFTILATALKEAGIAEESISRGGLKAAGYLRTIFDEHDSKKVAEVVAGSLHAFNLSDSSLLKYIDIMQRAHYAYGMTLDDFKYGLPYLARAYGLLNPKGGLQAATNQTIMMGMLKQGGMEGSMIGESIGSFYTQLATRGSRLEFGLGRRGLMTKAGEYLKKYHTDLTVFDKKGGYVGDDALVKQIWRLKQMGATAQEISIIGNSLAGAVGSTIFTKLYQQGPQGWQAAEKRLQDQMDLNQKIERLLNTLKNVKEAGMGTVTNLAATLGGAIAPDLKKFFDRLNDVTGRLQIFFEKQEKGNTVLWKLTKWVLLGTLALGAFGIGLGLGSLAVSAILRPIGVLISLFRGLTVAVAFFKATTKVGMFGEIITGASPAALWLAKITTALRTATIAARAFFLTTAGTALVAAAAFAAVAAAIYQLVKHWDSLKRPGLLKDLWGWATFQDPEKLHDNATAATRAREARERAGRTPVGKLAVAAAGNNFTYSPQVVIQGNADRAHVEQALATGREDFRKDYQRMLAQDERRKF